MDATATKVVVMVILGLVCFIIGAITWKVSGSLKRRTRGRKETTITSLLLCFGAGVLMATCLLHILPEAREELEELGEKWEVHWLGELFLCLGFFLVYLVEEMVHTLLHKTDHKEELHRTFSMRKTANPLQECGDASETISTVSTQGELNKGCCETEAECHNDMERRGSDESGSTKYNPKYEVRLSLSTNSMFPNYHAQDATTEAKSAGTGGNSLKNGGGQQHQPLNNHSHAPTQTDNIIKDLMTVMALSFHCVFEGIAVGVEAEAHDVWTLFTAIAIHKFVITFCVCVELLQSETKTLFYFVYLATFSLVSPLGIGIGIAISEMGENEETHAIVIGILQGISAGTIVYVVMFEVLQREKDRSVSGVMQLLAVILGFAVIMTLELVGGHDHEDEHAAHIGDVIHRHLGPGHLDDGHTQFVPLEDTDHDHHGHDHEDLLVDEGYLVVDQGADHLQAEHPHEDHQQELHLD